MSKKLFVRDPEAAAELKIYIAVAAVLLVVRLLVIRQLVIGHPILLERSGKSKGLIQPAKLPDHGGETLPAIQGRESGVSVTPTFVIASTISNHPLRKMLRESPENFSDSPTIELPLEEEPEVQ